ncbi:MAG: ABC transporter permease [Bacteroidota bacterium]
MLLCFRKKTAKRYFNSTDIVGKRLRYDNTLDLQVSGVFKDFPSQSHYHPDFLISFVTLEDDNIYGRRGLETNWEITHSQTYVLFSEGTDPNKVAERFPAFLDKHYGTFAKANFNAGPDFVASKTTQLTLQKVTDIHLVPISTMSSRRMETSTTFI